MPTILHIDTATQFCSVALIENRNVVSVKAGHEKNAHSRVITVFIDEIFKENKIAATTLDAIAVSRAPDRTQDCVLGYQQQRGFAMRLTNR